MVKNSVAKNGVATPQGSKAVYELKISLVGAKPAIWRRFRVSNQISLAQLHDVVQRVMGWEDCHLHSFRVQDQAFSDAETSLEMEWFADESKVLLGDVLQQPKEKMHYEYDFGDSWEHLIVLEKVLPTSMLSGKAVAEVVKGEGACPLEDIGGLDGWYYFLDVIAHPESEEYQDEEHQQMCEWVEEDFNPRFYDVKAVNEVLGRGI
ncbi:MAG: plasmid pRiA4b ORF-3 family protein [Pseudomonadota bacterium]|nr:plasmid pRiA4b ORF-3 family protein [Pseudomonadota bacterium]